MTLRMFRRSGRRFADKNMRKEAAFGAIVRPHSAC
jgi:hypothetical protein